MNNINNITNNLNNLLTISKSIIAKVIIGLVSLIIFTVSIPNLSDLISTPVQAQDYSQGLSGQDYLDYTARMAKELNDIDYGYETIVARNRSTSINSYVDYIKNIFPNINFDIKQESKYPNNHTKKDKCDIKENKYILYYINFSSICNFTLAGAGNQYQYKYIEYYNKRIKEIAKNDNFGYESYDIYPNPQQRGYYCSIGLTKLQELNTFYKKIYKDHNEKDFLTDGNSKQQEECINEFKKNYPKFVPDKSKCDTSDWLIFELELKANPHCSMVNINDVPLKLKYYYTSWGLYRIGEKPDPTKDQRLNYATVEEALADNDPAKPKEVLERQKVQREQQRIDQEKKDKAEEKAKEGTNPGTEEADRIFFENEKKEKERLNNIRAPSSFLIDKTKDTIDKTRTKIKTWLIATGLIYLLEDLIDYYSFTIPITILLFGVYYGIRKFKKF